MTDNFFVEHLNKANQDFFIVDKTAVHISGKVIFLSPYPTKIDKCDIEKEAVYAIDARSDEVILNTNTNGAGEFNFSGAKQTQLRLKVAYHNHTFVGAPTSQASINLFSHEGVLVT